MRLISKAEFARERSVHPSRVSQWLRDGRVVEADGGRIDADQAHAMLEAHLDRAKGARRNGHIGSSSPVDLLPAEGAGAAPGNGGNGSGVGAPADGGAGEPAAPRSAGTRDESGYWEHKARREKAESQLAVMKALQAAGALVSAPASAKEAREVARVTRNALLSMVDRLAPVLDPASPALAHKLLTEEVTKVLRELHSRLVERVAGTAAARERDPALV